MSKHILQFKIYKGDTHYIGEGTDIPVVTQGKTVDEVINNIKEAVNLYFEGENLHELDIAPNPSGVAILELDLAHA